VESAVLAVAALGAWCIMEDLEAFELSLVNVQGASAGSHKATSAEKALALIKAPCPGQPSIPGGGHAPTTSSTESTAEPKDKDCSCPGCLRSKLHGVDFMDPSKRIEWAGAGGQGSWCGDCYGAWKTLHSQTHPLTLFASSLQKQSNSRQQRGK
jgi:hypothetical protein